MRARYEEDPKASDHTRGYRLFRSWRLFGIEFRSDLISHDYMRRWTLRTPWRHVRLHHILRGDGDRHYHDHPMDFKSLILSGGYVEHRPGRESVFYGPGSVVSRTATDAHRLELLPGRTAWTLVVTSPFYREWGFITEDGWIAAKDYDEWREKRYRNGLRPV